MNMNVKLIPLPAGGWQVVHDNHVGNQPSNYPHVKLGLDTGPHVIFFELAGNNNGIAFSGDPIWVNDGPSPPKPNEKSSQIPDAFVVNGGKGLIVLDKNDNFGWLSLHYQLNFDGHPSLDPIIDNGGTSKPPFLHLDYAALGVFLAAAFVLGILAHWGVRALRGR